MPPTTEVLRVSTIRDIPEDQLAQVQQDFLDYGATTNVTQQPDGLYQIEARMIEVATAPAGLAPNRRER